MCGEGILEENGNLEKGIFVVVKEGKENREKEKGKDFVKEKNLKKENIENTDSRV